MQQNSQIVFVIALLTAIGLVSCSDSEPGGIAKRQLTGQLVQTPDFFFPEMSFYRRELETAGLTSDGTSLERFLLSLRDKTRATNGSTNVNKLSRQDSRMLRAVLYVIAVDEIPGLASPILNVLPTVDDRRVWEAGVRALVATLRENEVSSRLRRGLADSQADSVRVVCLRVAARLGRQALEPRVVDLCNDASPDVRLEAAIALATWGRPSGLEPLLSLLTSDRLATRHLAGVVLRQWTGEDFGYSAYHTDEERARAIARWRKWFDSFDKALLQPLRARDSDKVLVVRGKELLELGPDGRILHRLGGFNSLSEAVYLDSGHRLVTDFMGQTLTEYDDEWKQVGQQTMTFQPRGGLRLPDGSTLVIGMSRYQLFDSGGYPVGAPVTFSGHVNFTGSTLVGKTRFLVTCNDTGIITEFNLGGQPLWKIQAENYPRSVQLLDDGRLLVADFRQAVIYSPPGKVDWRHRHHDVRTARQLPSGNILLIDPTGLSVIDLSGEVLWELKHPVVRDSFFVKLRRWLRS